MNYLIAAHHVWNEDEFKKISKRTDLGKFFFISKKEDLSLEKLSKINPKYIFFPHWSYIVPKEILDKYECVCFHMTDLPFGRGGSPLQNLISRGFTETKITALRMSKELDSGPVYLKKKMKLEGRAETIYKRASKIIFKMIENIILTSPRPAKQKGKVVNFKRRKPEDSKIEGISSIERMYDFIRMLDAPGYPHAFLETKKYRIIFQNARLDKRNQLEAKVTVTEREAND